MKLFDIRTIQLLYEKYHFSLLYVHHYVVVEVETRRHFNNVVC